MTKLVLAIVSILLMGLGGILAVSNHNEARRQATAIVAKDNNGQPTDTERAALKSYASIHTFGGVTVTLEAAYGRAQAQARTQADAAVSNNQLYSAAQQACSGRTDSVTQARCVQTYVSQRLTAAPAPVQVAAPKANDFTYVYASPFWSADAAGASLLGGLAALIMAGLMQFGRKRYGR